MAIIELLTTLLRYRAPILLLFMISIGTYYNILYMEPRMKIGPRFAPYVEVVQNRGESVFDKCHLEVINHLAPELLPFHHPDYNPKAGCTPYIPMTMLSNKKVYLTDKARGFECLARCVHPSTDDRTYRPDKWIVLPSSQAFHCDIVETSCKWGQLREGFLHSQIHENCSFDETFGGSRCKHSNLPSVYIIVLDSVSSSMAKRSLPKSLSFIKNSMDGTFMEFLNRVGVGSKANGFPMAFGKTIEAASRSFVGLPPLRADWNTTTVCGEYLDKHDYHLHQYMAQGYKAMVAQDSGPGVPYYANCKGFKRPEADHLWRPFQLRIDQSIQLRNSLERSCYERHLDMLEYLEKFVSSYPGVPKIAQIWPTALAHDTVKNLYHSDDHFLSFFKENKQELDNAFVFFMGDHGPRRDGIGETSLGQYEANNPFLLITVPRNYRNTSIHNQLREKTHQLMTPYDIHATLMDILKLQPKSNFTDVDFRDMSPLSKGSSLLRRWKGVRNCRNLPIPPQYCLCQYNKTTVSDPQLHRQMGAFLAEKLNEFLRANNLHKICAPQEYRSVKEVLHMKDGAKSLYVVKAYLHPSGGLFEAHVTSTAHGLQLSSGFTRWDQYGDQGKCKFGTPFEPFCQCREALKAP